MPALKGRPGAYSFFASIVIDSLGLGLYLPVSLLYFTKVAGISLATVGWCVSAAGLLTLPLPLVIGRYVERFGARVVVVLGSLMQGVAFVGYLFTRDAVPLLIFSLCAMIGTRLFWSSLFTLIADLAAPVERDKWYSLTSAARNIGIGLGSVVAAGLLAFGGTSVYHLVVAVNGITYLIAAGLVLWRVPNGEHHVPPAAGRTAGSAVAGPFRDLPFLAFTALNTVFAICVTMLGVGVPVYLDSGLHAPGWVVGAISAVNITLLALVQTSASHLVRGFRRSRVIVAAAVLWAVWCGLMAGAFALPTGWALVTFLFVIMLAYCGAELLHGPASNAISAEASPPAARGRYLSIFQLSFAIANAVAPAFFAQAYELHPMAPWILLGSLCVVSGGGMLALERRLPHESVRAPMPRSPAPERQLPTP